MSTTYTAKAHSIIPIVFKCEHCGKITSVKHVLGSTAMQRTNSFSSRVHEETKEDAQLEADKLNAELRDQVIKEAKEHKYTNAEFRCKCEHCKKKPLWAHMSYDRLTTVFAILLFLAFAAFVISLFPLLDGNIAGFVSLILKLLLPPAGGAVLLVIGMNIHKRIISKKVLNMDEKYLPVICSTTTEIEQAIKELSK